MKMLAWLEKERDDEIENIGSWEDHAHGYSSGFNSAFELLSKDIEILREAMKTSVARSDDYGDSHCSKPIREALEKTKKYESEER